MAHNDRRLVSRLAQATQPRQLLPALTAGLIVGILDPMIEISLAALIFSGPLAAHVGSGIGLMLFGSCIMCIVAALTSSWPGMIMVPQDTTAAILALIAATLAQRMPASATSETLFLTVVAALALSSLLSGLFFFGMGRLKLGRLIRFAPYPVVGGFLAGTGWLLVQGAIGVMAGVPPSLAQIPYLLQVAVLEQWLPGVIFALLLMVIMRRYMNILLMPAMFAGSIALFYLLLWLTHTSQAQAGTRGWLLPALPSGGLWQPLVPAALAGADWPALFGQMDKLGTIVLISMISLLLNISGLELVVRQDLDLDRELQGAGIANLVAGLAGSPVGFHTLSFSALGHRMGSRTRLVGLVAAVLSGAALFFGAALLPLMPKAVLGGLILFLGLSFLVEWVYDSWFTLPRLDYGLVLIILVVVGAIGFLEGVVAGLMIAVVLFVVNYSRVDVVKHALSGADYQSRVTRSPHARQFLREQGNRVYILQLQGFLFFGTGYSLLDKLRRRLSDPQLPPLRFVVLDFRQVSGLDATALLGFAKLKQLAEAQQITLVLTHLSEKLQQQFAQGAFGAEAQTVPHLFPDLDHGLEWCENQLLAAAGMTNEALQEQLQALLPQSFNAAGVLRYLDQRQLERGEYLIRQGDPADGVYFIASGQVTAQIERMDQEPVRLETQRSGHVVGEIGFYLGNKRTAAVVADEPSTVYYLTSRALQRMEQDAPEMASTLHQIIIHLLAERVVHLSNTVDALQRS